MKTLSKPGLILMIILFGLPAYGATPPVTIPIEVTNQIEINRITSRLEEIKAMDKSTLSAKERRALKKELKEMKNEMRALAPDDDDGGGGVYLSVGAIIIIILLLILIL